MVMVRLAAIIVLVGGILDVLPLSAESQRQEAGTREERGLTATWPKGADGWVWDGAAREYTPATLYEHIDGAAEVFLAYRFVHAWVLLYERQGHPSITAEIYRMGSLEDARGIFSLDKQDPGVGIGQGSEFGGGMLRFWKGDYFVTVIADGEGKAVESAMLNIGRAVAAVIRAGKPMPGLRAYLPAGPGTLAREEILFLRSHIVLNRRFFVAHQNILGLNPAVSAILAPYKMGSGKTHLFLAQYPSDRLAREAFEGFAVAYMPEAGGKDGIRIEDNSWTQAVRIREFLVIVFGAPGLEQARALTEGAVERLEAKRK